ncbi:MAG: TetR/AcrR family transcriptional regulator, partial [Actinomycetales bacterium]|nr:TetR/AcrR family transcriptional regulator [Actinomycetales bacterium]
GIVIARYGVAVEPLASASEDEVVALVGPTIQRLLDPTQPLSAPVAQ